jgi:NAD-dependent deacetylase
MRIVVLTGAGMSAESGVMTFRGNGGLWENHRIEDVATPEAFARNPELVLRFYNQRRAQLNQVEPNAGHLALAKLEKNHEVKIITQNVDDLHERAGSTQVLHLHGKLREVRSVRNPEMVLPWTGDLNLGDTGPNGAQLRPNIIWFGEAVPAMDEAVEIARTAEHFLIIGTSLQVYPAASLYRYIAPGIPCTYIDPSPNRDGLDARVRVIPKGAGEGVPEWVTSLSVQSR